jgi:hypothetical protein
VSRAERAVAMVVAVVLAAGAAPSAEAIEADDLEIVDLRVSGSESDWQAENRFQLEWGLDDAAAARARVVWLRLYDQLGAPLGAPTASPASVRTFDRLEVPTRGTFRSEIWLEDYFGRTGPPASVDLRFDDLPPAPPTLQTAPGWLGGDEPAALRIEPARAAAPISGIRGYAIATGGAFPCARSTHCTVAETDLVATDGGSFSLGTLPEGETAVEVVGVSGSGVPSGLAAAAIRVDSTRPNVSLEGLPSGWANEPVRLRARAHDELSGMAAAGPAGPYTAIGVDGGVPTVSQGNTVTAVVAGSGVHEVAYFARDAAGNAADGLGAPPATARVRIDEVAPTVVFAAAQDPAEPERVEARVSDGLSGPGDGRGWIGVRPAGSRARFQPLPTTVSAERLVAIWDSDAYPDGRYEFLATGYDAAGNAGTGTSRARGGRMVLVNPLKQPVKVEARLHSAQPQVPYGRRVRLAGRLRSTAGEGVGGRAIAVTETFGPGAEPGRRMTDARTREDGTFSLLLPAGPSRDVVVSFAGDRLLTRAVGARLHLAVRGRVNLRASTPSAKIGGQPVVFSGRLAHRGAPLAQQGRPVQLQFRYPGAGWSDFRTIRTDSRGRFRYAYAFSDDDSRGVRFQFRAVVTAEEGWPYEAAPSRPISVFGR